VIAKSNALPCDIDTKEVQACQNTTTDNSRATISQQGYRIVSAGEDYTCGLRMNSTIVCWGKNDSGQIDAPTGIFQNLSAGYFHACSMSTQGSLTCWGSNDHRQLESIPGGAFASVDAGYRHTCAVRANGSLACWGDNDWGQLINIPSESFTMVATGWTHTCALRSDRTLACWGTSIVGQLVNIPTGTFTAVDAGFAHTCALRTDGSLACWGDDSVGQLQNIPGGMFTAVSTGWGHTCALRTDGSLACWGENEAGQANTPAGTFISVDAGTNHTCAITTAHTTVCWGDNGFGQTTPPVPPTITAHPADQTVISGESFTLSVTAMGTPQLTYQWYKDGAAIAGATNASYTVTAATIGDTGTYTVTVSNAEGSVSSHSALVTVAKAAQTIAFSALDDTIYGVAPILLNATASSNLPVTFSVLGGPAVIDGNTLAIQGAGTITVRASQQGNDAYEPAPTVEQSLVVTPAPLTIEVNDVTRAYGVPNPPFSVTYMGFVNGDTSADLSGTLTFTTQATEMSSPGTYVITPSGLTASNYIITFVDGVLTIEQLQLRYFVPITKR